MSTPYQVRMAPAARRALTHTLPESAAAAAWELISGGLATDPRRVGKPLRHPLEGQWVARRSTYRIFYRIDDSRYTVTVLTIKSRADAYRSG